MEVKSKQSKVDIYLEDYGTKPVPIEKTKTWFGMGMVIWGISTCIPAFMLGGILAASAKLGPAIAAILIGSAVLTVISLATGVIGAHTRLSTAMTSKLTFGIHGNHLMAVLLCIGAFGWFAIQLEVFGQAINGAIQIFTNNAVTLPRWLVIIVGGLLMMSTAFVGYKAIEKLSIWVVPLLVILLIVTLVKAYSGTSFAQAFAKTPANTLPFGILVSITAGAYAVGATIQPDITRYARSKGHAAGGMVFGMMAGFPLIVALAALLGGAAGTGGFTDIMLQYHSGLWGVFAMFVIVFATWTTNDNNLYSASLALNAIFTRMKKWHVTAIMGVVAIIIALFGLLSQFMNWLIALGVTMPPIAAIMAVEFFFFRSSEITFDYLKSTAGIRVITYISWAVAAAFGFLTFFKVFTFTTAPALDAVIVAFVLHFILMLATGHKMGLPKKS
jgi:cytosine permease